MHRRKILRADGKDTEERKRFLQSSDGILPLIPYAAAGIAEGMKTKRHTSSVYSFKLEGPRGCEVIAYNDEHLGGDVPPEKNLLCVTGSCLS